MSVKLKRVYEPSAKTDGYRILVDRLWPRGIRKEDANIDRWFKEVAPSNALRKWFNHDPQKWKSFMTKYKKELRETDALKELKLEIKKHKKLTLLYGAKDEEHNQARALVEIIGNS